MLLKITLDKENNNKARKNKKTKATNNKGIQKMQIPTHQKDIDL